MGIVFVLLMWVIIGLILASIGAIISWGLAAHFTRNVTEGRKSALFVASLFPFACLLWGGAVFVFQAAVNEVVFDRDPWAGDARRCPLPNGYALLMIDAADHGYVYNPKTQRSSGLVVPQEDAVPDVIMVQVAGQFIAGMTESRSSEAPPPGATVGARYFLLNAQTGRRSNFPTLDALRQAASQLGFQLGLEPIEKVYFRYRLTWFDAVAGLLFLAPPAAAAFLIARWILVLRRLNAAPP